MERSHKHWFFYASAFILIEALLLAINYETLQTSFPNILPLLANIFAVSAGTAFTLAILVEVIIAMVLFAPKIKEHFKSQGRAEGRAEGHTEGKAEANHAARDWFTRKEAAEKAGVPFSEPPPWET